ncbi:cid14 [Symbiodinium sp. CCMP2592]|nr:cid14 [Symbiodinium sp. CCMP2592]
MCQQLLAKIRVPLLVVKRHRNTGISLIVFACFCSVCLSVRLFLSADGPADKAKKEADDSAVKAAESSDKDKESKAEKIAESASKEQASADKSGEEAAKKEATSKGKTQATKEDTKKDAEAIKEKPATAKKVVETAKDEPKPAKATAEQAAKDKDENETKDTAKTSEKASEAAKEKADAKSEKADAAKEKEEKTDENEEKAPAAVPAAAPAASPAAAPAAEAVVDKKEKDKAKESADSGSGTVATTSTTLSVYDAPNVQKVTTTIGPVDNETLSAYMKECAQQLKAIVKKAESYYTHEQLVIALRQECDLDKEFPTVRKVFFDHRRDCRKFAEELGAAREAELKGDTNAYSECCWTAWQEKSQAPCQH